MNSNQYYIPKYLDEPFRIIIFTIDEFIVILLPLLIIGLFIHELLGLAAATFAYFFYLKMKKKEASAYFKRKLYWDHAIQTKLKVMPPSKVRKLKG